MRVQYSFGNVYISVCIHGYSLRSSDRAVGAARVPFPAIKVSAPEALILYTKGPPSPVENTRCPQCRRRRLVRCYCRSYFRLLSLPFLSFYDSRSRTTRRATAQWFISSASDVLLLTVPPARR